VIIKNVNEGVPGVGGGVRRHDFGMGRKASIMQQRGGRVWLLAITAVVFTGGAGRQAVGPMAA